MDLFQAAGERDREADAPLAARMRPRTLDEIVGQEHLIGPGTPLRRAIEADRIPSMILWGPPGTGKTTLARVIARTTSARFVALNAVTSGVGDVRKAVEEAEESRALYRRRTIVFIDEIHRFNRSQQDALLPAVEAGTVHLIGATTENPFFSVNKPLLSRCRVFRLESLTAEEVESLLRRALDDRERGLGAVPVDVEPGALSLLADLANGDVRIALNTLEFAVMTAPPEPGGVRRLTREGIRQALQMRIPPEARDDEHYDLTSCFIKSMRGSDPQATLYWLARLIYRGEDPTFIARRIMIHAAEDVGLADPQALVVATAAAQAVERVGFPEGRIILAEAALYIALAPKSNAVVTGIDRALAAVEKHRLLEPPLPLRDASYGGARRLGHGVGYRYPHDYPNHWVEQRYLPEGLPPDEAEFYRPSDQGREPELWKQLQDRRR